MTHIAVHLLSEHLVKLDAIGLAYAFFAAARYDSSQLACKVLMMGWLYWQQEECILPGGRFFEWSKLAKGFRKDWFVALLKAEVRMRRELEGDGWDLSDKMEWQHRDSMPAGKGEERNHASDSNHTSESVPGDIGIGETDPIDNSKDWQIIAEAGPSGTFHIDPEGAKVESDTDTSGVEDPMFSLLDSRLTGISPEAASIDRIAPNVLASPVTIKPSTKTSWVEEAIAGIRRLSDWIIDSEDIADTADANDGPAPNNSALESLISISLQGATSPRANVDKLSPTAKKQLENMQRLLSIYTHGLNLPAFPSTLSGGSAKAKLWNNDIKRELAKHSLLNAHRNKVRATASSSVCPPTVATSGKGEGRVTEEHFVKWAKEEGESTNSPGWDMQPTRFEKGAEATQSDAPAEDALRMGNLPRASKKPARWMRAVTCAKLRAAHESTQDYSPAGVGAFGSSLKETIGHRAGPPAQEDTKEEGKEVPLDTVTGVVKAAGYDAPSPVVTPVNATAFMSTTPAPMLERFLRERMGCESRYETGQGHPTPALTFGTVTPPDTTRRSDLTPTDRLYFGSADQTSGPSTPIAGSPHADLHVRSTATMPPHSRSAERLSSGNDILRDEEASDLGYRCPVNHTVMSEKAKRKQRAVATPPKSNPHLNAAHMRNENPTFPLTNADVFAWALNKHGRTMEAREASGISYIFRTAHRLRKGLIDRQSEQVRDVVQVLLDEEASLAGTSNWLTDDPILRTAKEIILGSATAQDPQSACLTGALGKEKENAKPHPLRPPRADAYIYQRTAAIDMLSTARVAIDCHTSTACRAVDGLCPRHAADARAGLWRMCHEVRKISPPWRHSGFDSLVDLGPAKWPPIDESFLAWYGIGFHSNLGRAIGMIADLARDVKLTTSTSEGLFHLPAPPANEEDRAQRQGAAFPIMLTVGDGDSMQIDAISAAPAHLRPAAWHELARYHEDLGKQYQGDWVHLQRRKDHGYPWKLSDDPRAGREYWRYFAEYFIAALGEESDTGPVDKVA